MANRQANTRERQQSGVSNRTSGGPATWEQTAAEIVLVIGKQLGRAIEAQTAEEAAIALETEVYRQAPLAAPEALLAVPRAAVAARA